MGSGFKDWAAGDVLTAADVDGYLMRQTVMTFADASARDTALSGVLDEGMVAYLEDTNAITVYNGSGWVSVIDSDVLTVDTSNNRVGINDSTPSYALDVTGDINATGDLRIGGTAIGAWTTYTPVVDQNGAVAATVSFARYTRINQTITGYARLAVTGTGAAGFALSVTLPVAANGQFVLTGTGQLFDSSTSVNYQAGLVMTGNDVTTAWLSGDWSGANVWGTNPSLAVGNGDVININFTYEAA